MEEEDPGFLHCIHVASEKEHGDVCIIGGKSGRARPSTKKIVALLFHAFDKMQPGYNGVDLQSISSSFNPSKKTATLSKNRYSAPKISRSVLVVPFHMKLGRVGIISLLRSR
jgi:hypothetical protein